MKKLVQQLHRRGVDFRIAQLRHIVRARLATVGVIGGDVSELHCYLDLNDAVRAAAAAMQSDEARRVMLSEPFCCHKDLC